MPFLVDPWSQQYFEDCPLPDGLDIPLVDEIAWEAYPRYRWVYNKLLIAETQGLPHGPHATDPPRFPVFSKPIYNLYGMGTGSRVIRSARAYLLSLEPGHMWMPLLTGTHVSTDVALARGAPRWWRHATGRPGPRGTFDYWTVHAGRRPALEGYLAAWILRHLAGFTGIVNFETIGGRIIECHLRMTDQWLDLNGQGWLRAVVRLYRDGVWRFRDDERRTGYSVVLFGAHGVRWSIDRRAAADLLKRPGVSSLQITFDDATPHLSRANPPGGFRLAIVNGWDLAAARRVRAQLKGLFRARS